MSEEDREKLEKAAVNIGVVIKKCEHMLPAIYYISLLTAKDFITEVLER